MVENTDNRDLLYKTVIARIKQLILTGDYAVGDRLPSERELAAIFNVSRVPVREAIKILDYQGIVETRQGAGIFLKSTLNFALLSSKTYGVSMSPASLIELFEMRSVLESNAGYFAAQRRTAEDIEKLQKIIATSREERTRLSIDELRVLSHQFHTAIIDSAHNTILSSLYRSMYDLLEVSKEWTINQYDHSVNSVIVHELITEKVINGDAEGARDSILLHLEDARERLIQALKTSPPLH